MAAAIRLSQQHSCSLDHLVGERKKLVRHLKAERLGSPKVQYEFEFGGLHGQLTPALFTKMESGPVGKRLVQQLDLLLRQLQLLKDKTGDVAARPRQAGDVAAGWRS
jgi:hypothetical protein